MTKTNTTKRPDVWQNADGSWSHRLDRNREVEHRGTSGDRQGCMKKERNGGGVTDLAAAKKERERKRYASLVLKAWDDFEHDDKRQMLDRKGEVQIKARERL